MDATEVLKTVGGLINLAAPGAGTALMTVSNLIALATSAAATAQDAQRSWDLISGHSSGDTGIEELEAEIEALEARGLKPVEPEED